MPIMRDAHTGRIRNVGQRYIDRFPEDFKPLEQPKRSSSSRTRKTKGSKRDGTQATTAAATPKTAPAAAPEGEH
ncbi:MAG: hypothetical protein FJW64_16485 [Actinobacteria bacterium]|nr:hypothetical protein [Actinomycetota bacterium]